MAKKSHEAKNETAKLKKVQDQASSSIDVKKSLINLWPKRSDVIIPLNLESPVPVMDLLSPTEGVDPSML